MNPETVGVFLTSAFLIIVTQHFDGTKVARERLFFVPFLFMRQEVSFSGLLHAMKGGGEEEGDGGQDLNLRGYKYQRSEESTVRHQSGRIERAEKTHFYSNEFLPI